MVEQLEKNNQIIMLKPATHKLTVGSLFAGIGGIDKAFIDAGFEISWANEIDKNACKTYKANFSHILYEEDIKKLDPEKCPQIDILTAGFPCQAFSVAGRRMGFKDERGSLFYEIVKFIKYLQPKAVFLENVKNIQTHNNGKTLQEIIGIIKRLGYFYQFKVLNTAEYGNIPQNRERFYLVAFLNKKHAEKFEFPEPLNLTSRIDNFLNKECKNSKYFYENKKIYPILKEKINKTSTIYQWRRIYVRENKSGMCPTLTANMGMGGHNVPLIFYDGRIRKLMPRECANFQGFPNSFIFPEVLSDASLYKQIGNSVSIPVVKRIAERILKVLN